MSKRQLQRSLVVSTNDHDDDDDDDDDAIFVLYCTLTNNRRRSNNNDQRQRRRLLPLEFPILIGVVFNQACVRACAVLWVGVVFACAARVFHVILPCPLFQVCFLLLEKEETDGRAEGRGKKEIDEGSSSS